MAIPPFNDQGWLPEGIHDCTVEEAAARFGNFQGSDRRPKLWRRFMDFLAESRASGLIEHILVDGSFVTAKAAPEDIDLIAVTSISADLPQELLPLQYNVLMPHRVRRRFGFDITVAKNYSTRLEIALAFFIQVKQRPGGRKGLIRIQV